MVLVVLKALDTGASIQLRSQKLICLHKSIKLSRQVRVLCLKNLGMALQSFLLIEAIVLSSQILMLYRFLTLDISSSNKEVFL